jgi:hypothetical protein
MIHAVRHLRQYPASSLDRRTLDILNESCKQWLDWFEGLIEGISDPAMRREMRDLFSEEYAEVAQAYAITRRPSIEEVEPDRAAGELVSYHFLRHRLSVPTEGYRMLASIEAYLMGAEVR